MDCQMKFILIFLIITLPSSSFKEDTTMDIDKGKIAHFCYGLNASGVKTLNDAHAFSQRMHTCVKVLQESVQHLSDKIDKLINGN
jgi:hypothetical protein